LDFKFSQKNSTFSRYIPNFAAVPKRIRKPNTAFVTHLSHLSIHDV